MEHTTIRNRTHEGVNKIMDKAESLRDSSKEKMSSFKKKATMMKNNVDGYIRKNPKKSLLVAAGIGAVVGGVTATTMRRKHKLNAATKARKKA